MLLFPPSFPWGLQDPWADLLAYTKHSVCQGSSRGQIWNKEALCWLYPWDTRRINANKLKYILARSCSIFPSPVCWPDGLRCYESHQRRNVTASVFLSYTYTLLIFRLSTSDEMMKRVLSATCRCIGWSGTAALTLFSQGRERQRRYCAAFKISQKSHGPAYTPIIKHYLAAFCGPSCHVAFAFGYHK